MISPQSMLDHTMLVGGPLLCHKKDFAREAQLGEEQMSDIRRRLKKAEEKLNLNQEHKIVTIVDYSGFVDSSGELPPDRTYGNITVRYVAYEDVSKDKALQCETYQDE